MKKLRILLTLVLIISGTVANAYSFMADGIYYNIDGNTVSVTYLSDHSSNYSGAVSIPSTVTYNGVTYRVTSIGDRAFANCKNLTSIDIPSSVTSIGDAAFTECDGLTFISLPNKLTSIGKYAFSSCKNIKSVSIPGSVVKIGDCSFSRCSNLQNVTINNGVQEIGLYAFEKTGINKIDIPNSLKVILGYAFMDCDNLESFTLPEDIECFGPYVFAGTKWERKNVSYSSSTLEYIYIGQNDYILYSCNGKAKGNVSEIKEGTKIIAGTAIRDKDWLEVLEIPNSVTSIGTIAFGGNMNLKKVVFGSGLKMIYSELFWDCPNLSEIYMNTSVPPKWLGNPLYELLNMEEEPGIVNSVVKENCILYVPVGSKNLYEDTYPWNQFKNIVETGDNTTDDCTFTIGADKLYGYRTTMVDIEMENAGEVIAFQCDINLSEGVEIEKDNDGDYTITLTERAHKTHSVTIKDVDRDIRILAYSSKNVAFSGNEGALFSLPIAVNEDISECEITIKNIIVTDSNRQEKSVPDVKVTLPVVKTLPGDSNGDGNVTVTDITFIIDLIMDVENPNVVFAGADANGDGNVTVTDITEVIATIMNNQ